MLAPGMLLPQPACSHQTSHRASATHVCEPHQACNPISRRRVSPERQHWRRKAGRNGWVLTAVGPSHSRGFAACSASLCPKCWCSQNSQPDGGGSPPKALQRLQAGRQCHGPSSKPCLRLSQCSAAGTLALGLGGGGGGSSLLGYGHGGGGGSGGRHGTIPAAAKAPVATSGSEDVILLDVTGMRCGSCVSRVKSILEQEPPVVQVTCT